MATVLPKKTPCNGCRERKRKCTYEQPCARCVKAGTECIYTVMPSPKDLEYMQELEYIKQMDEIQHQITCMENEISVIKLSNEIQEKTQTPPSSETNTAPLSDYPSPISIDKPISFDNGHERHGRHKHRKLLLPDPFVHYKEEDPILINSPPPSDTDLLPVQCKHTEHFLKHKRGHHWHDREKKSRYPLFKHKTLEAELSKQKESEPWTLTVKNGTMTIDTHIKSHAELMACLSNMVPAALYQSNAEKMPFPFTAIPEGSTSALNRVLGVIIWRKYGKTRFKTLTKYTPAFLANDTPPQLTCVIPIEGLTAITMRLIMVYFQCLHQTHFSVYMPEFIRLYMNGEQEITQSPAVMAYCSNICQQRCRHLQNILPREAIPEYGQYYFEQARELIEDKFDEATLETLFTYTCLASYKLKAKQKDEAERYISLAERIYALLLPQYEYKQGAELSGGAMFFSRIYLYVRHVRFVLTLDDERSRMFTSRASSPHKVFKLLDSRDEVKVHAFPGDTPREVEMIKMREYIRTMRISIKEGTRCAASAPDLPSYISVFGHHIEMALRHWYRKVLPPEFQLSLPLFEDYTSDIDFFTTLEKECSASPVPLLTTIAVYDEYLIMGKSYAPKDPSEVLIGTDELISKFKSMLYTTEHKFEDRRDASLEPDDRARFWFHIIDKVMYFKKFHKHQFREDELEMSDEEYFEKFARALNPSQITFDMPIIHTSVRAALNIVRLVQFLLSRQDVCCFFDLRWIMSAWEVLLRAARFRYQQPGDTGVTLDRIRANLLLCIAFIKEHFELTGRDLDGAFVNEMRQQFEKLF